MASSAETPDLTLTVTNNNISQTDGNGILLVGRGVTGTAKLGIRNNTVAAPLAGVRPGIRVDAGNASSVDDAVCLDIRGNTTAGSTLSGVTSAGIGLRKQGTVTTTHDFGIEGMTATNSPGVEQFVGNGGGLNPGSANGVGDGSVNGVLLISATSGFSNCSAAPIAPPVDTNEQRLENQSNRQAQAASPNPAGAPGFLAQVRQWLRPVFTAFATPLGYVKLENAFSKATEAIAPTASAAEYVVPPSGGSVSAGKPIPAEAGTTNTNRPARTMVINSRGEARSVPTASLAAFVDVVTVNNGGGGFTLPAGKSTTIMFNATISSSYTNASISNQASVAGTGFSVMSNNLSTDVIQPPILAKNFASPFVRTNGTVNLNFALVNPNNSQTLTQLAFSDVLPVGLNVADGTQSACGGTVTTTAATRTISFSGGSLAVGPPCTFSVAVTAGTTEGTMVNALLSRWPVVSQALFMAS